jgi:hypothetical protein
MVTEHFNYVQVLGVQRQQYLRTPATRSNFHDDLYGSPSSESHGWELDTTRQHSSYQMSGNDAPQTEPSGSRLDHLGTISERITQAHDSMQELVRLQVRNNFYFMPRKPILRNPCSCRVGHHLQKRVSVARSR